METALYDEKRGFYPSRVPRADFYTAPELHPAFAQVLAGEIVLRLERIREARPRSPLFIVEVGSGTGVLARQILNVLRGHHPRWFQLVRYVLVERVESLLLKSIFELQDTGAGILGYSRLEDMPPLCGVFLSNELVDALPAHVLVKSGGVVKELHVQPRRKHGRPGGALTARPMPLSHPALFGPARQVAPALSEGQMHSVCLEAGHWLASVSRRLRAGCIITVDYGKQFSPADPNPPRGFRRHAHTADLLDSPGRQDLTASVDFAALERAGAACGLRSSLFATLSSFLMKRGILDLLPRGDSPEAWSQRAKIKTLFHPEGMGEAFKVLIQEKG